VNRTSALILAAATAAAAFVGGLAAGRGPAATEAVRTVDVARLLQEHQPFVAAYESMMAEFKPEVERLSEQKGAIDLQKGELATMDAASEAFRVRKFEIEVQEKALMTHLEFWKDAQRREREKLLQLSVTRIHEACAEYGRRTGVSAVLMRPGSLPEAADESSAALRDLESRWVIWTHGDHDVTDQVLAILREQ
jgi:Skp family chaperone for outer membrane proteins